MSAATVPPPEPKKVHRLVSAYRKLDLNDCIHLQVHVRLQLIHDSRAHLHQPMPVPQQLSPISILRARYLNLRKVIFPHQPEQESGQSDRRISNSGYKIVPTRLASPLM
jgi:hypothetical protein